MQEKAKLREFLLHAFRAPFDALRLEVLRQETLLRLLLLLLGDGRVYLDLHRNTTILLNDTGRWSSLLLEQSLGVLLLLGLPRYVGVIIIFKGLPVSPSKALDPDLLVLVGLDVGDVLALALEEEEVREHDHLDEVFQMHHYLAHQEHIVQHFPCQSD